MRTNYRRNTYQWTPGNEQIYVSVGIRHEGISPRLREARRVAYMRVYEMEPAKIDAYENWLVSLKSSGGAGHTWGPRAVTGF